MMASSIRNVPEFLGSLDGQLRVNEPMNRHTSWRTGGSVEFFYTPANKADLVNLHERLPQNMPVYWIGLGSNLLVRDGGVAGIVICTSKGLDQISVLEHHKLYVESGVSCAKVARIAARNNLKGAEFLAGVPGSFGGALAMNAGAFGGETWDWVEQIECVDRQGCCKTVQSKDIEYAYRHVELPKDHWILSGMLALEPAAEDYKGKDKIRSLLEQRSASQPIQSANAGSVFRNPPGDFAARLIDQSGLKGCASGDAIVSDVHANFIVNKGRATAQDIETLITIVRERVFENSGFRLELEVRIIGDAI